MKIFINLLFFFCLLFNLNAQVALKGKVIDAGTKEAIAYVNIGVKALAIGTVTDDNGDYSFEVKSSTDVVTISSVAYETKNLSAQKLQGMSIIELEKVAYEIPTIEVEATRFQQEEVMLGVKNKERGHSIGFGSAQLGTEIASIIPIDKISYIKTANFVLNHAKGDSLLFRINIYDFKDGQIGEKLLHEDVFILQKQKRGTITVDMESYNLILEADVLLSLEWLRNFDETGNEGITFDTKKTRKKRGIYVKYSSNGDFSKLPYRSKRKPCFYFTAKQAIE